MFNGAARLLMWRSYFAPLGERMRSRGLGRAVPASLALVTISLVLTALVHMPSPLRAAAKSALAYEGDDLYAVQLWRLVTSGLLAQSWAQWLWTLFIGVTVFAVLEAQVGQANLLACVAASHLVPTLGVALLAPLLGRADVLSQPDYGTYCLVIGAVAALSWVRCSVLLAAIIIAGLLADVVLSAPVTAAEHVAAMLVGTLLVAARPKLVRPAASPRQQVEEPSSYVTFRPRQAAGPAILSGGVRCD
jgi:membrane associated rhomboid family serine protease